jgi:hypothetical protein
VELLVATAITVVVTMVACRLAMGVQKAWRADGSRVDLQQRGRVAADLLSRALLEMGAGPHGGPDRGPLIRFLPPVVPRRTGRQNADPPDTMRRDAFTVVRAIAEAEHAMLLYPFGSGDSSVDVTPVSTCDLPVCGLEEGTAVLMFDATGNHDVFTVTDVAGQTLSLRHHGGGIHSVYAPGTPVIAVDVFGFYLDRNTRTLRRYDGDASDLPAVDDVVDMEVGYFGDIQPPVRPRPATGTSNCLYDAGGAYRSALLPVLVPAGASQAAVAEAIVTDGPWCGTGPNQFDADLLRVRRVRVALRLQASDPAVRGSDPVRFREPGIARDSSSLVPDAVVVVDVTPRNLRAAW